MRSVRLATARIVTRVLFSCTNQGMILCPQLLVPAPRRKEFHHHLENGTLFALSVFFGLMLQLPPSLQYRAELIMSDSISFFNAKVEVRIDKKRHFSLSHRLSIVPTMQPATV